MATDEELDNAALDISPDDHGDHGPDINPDINPDDTGDPAEAAIEAKPNDDQPVLPDEDHQEHIIKTEVGRRTKAIIESFEEKIARLEALVQPKPAEEPLGDDDDLVSVSKVKDILKAERERESAEQAAYGKTVQEVFLRAGLELDLDAHTAIADMAGKSFRRYTGNPQIDAQLNFDAAEKAYLKDQLAIARKASAKPVNPLAKNNGAGHENLGGPIDSSSGSPSPKMPKLDKAAAEFARSCGMSPETIAKALDGDAPAWMQGK